LVRRPVAVGLVTAVVLLVVGLGIAAVVLARPSHRSLTPTEAVVCNTARQVLASVQQPLEAGDIQGTIQAAQAAVPEAQPLGHQRGLSADLVRALNDLTNALVGTANGSSSSVATARKQLSAACHSDD
jgi:hypothetical protein